MSGVTQLYFQIVEENNYMFRFENTVALRRTFIHLISTSIESHNGDDATKDLPVNSDTDFLLDFQYIIAMEGTALPL
jgi:hypothetical protein